MLKSAVSVSGNGLVDGSYNPVGEGSYGDVFTVEDNVLTLHIPIGSYKKYSIPLKEPITVHTGDVTAFTGTPVVTGNGSIDDMNVNDNLITPDNQWANSLPFNSAKTVTGVINADGIVTAVTFLAHWFQSGNDRSLRLSFAINGEVVF